jgi:hypothetical protein
MTDIDPDLVSPEPPNIDKLVSHEKAMQAVLPAHYKGTSQQELEEWISAWNRVFRVKQWTYNRWSVRVNVASTLLKGLPQNRWEANVKSGYKQCPYSNWDAFKEFLNSLIIAKTARNTQAIDNYRKLSWEWKKESIQELYTRMLSIEADMGDQPTEKHRVDTLYSACKNNPSFSMSLFTINADVLPSTLDEFIDQCTRAEQASNRFRASRAAQNAERASERESKTPQDSGSGNQRPDRGQKKRKRDSHADSERKTGARPAPPRTNPGALSRDLAQVTCYGCGKKGHLANDPTKCEKHKDYPGGISDLEKAKRRLASAEKAYKRVNAAVQSDKGGASQETGNSAGKDKAKS